jgi:hypothetical protein
MATSAEAIERTISRTTKKYLFCDMVNSLAWQ